MLTPTDAKLLAAAIVAQRGGRSLLCVPDFKTADERFHRASLLLDVLCPDVFVFSRNTHLIRSKRSRGVFQIAIVGRLGDALKLRGLRYERIFRDERYKDAPAHVREALDELHVSNWA